MYHNYGKLHFSSSCYPIFLCYFLDMVRNLLPLFYYFFMYEKCKKKIRSKKGDITRMETVIYSKKEFNRSVWDSSRVAENSRFTQTL
ncbi:hypothetical protein L2E82_02835 [Cichorium intybus]|uniref:Uncharacterized protein n=1 Tax=Cichorium intybus TaxID=13427 RepID=A0ACB9H3W7_CICIN|nr:hypothetical protein L2E82_02835 [Cichorium intybus]